MERWAKERPRRGHQNPSFSSTLLDAVFRSIDAPDAGGGRADPAPAASAGRGSTTAAARPVIFSRASSSSSSSDATSFGGFFSSSSSENGSAGARRARIRANRPLTPLRSGSSPPPYHWNRIKASPIRIKATSAVLSPGERIAGFLGSLLAIATGKQRKNKAASGNAPCSMAVAASANDSRPCLLKSASPRRQAAAEGEGLKRSVRFHLGANAVRGGEQGAGKESDGRRTKEGKRKRREEMRKRLEEILRGLKEEEEEEEMMSDSSSDLFELETLTAAGGGGGGVYMDDELPVYSSTHLSTNRTISAILHL